MDNFYKIFEYFLDGVLIINEQKDVVYFNNSAQNIFKLRTKSVFGKKSYDHFLFKNQDLFCMKDGTVGKDQQSQYFEVDFRSSKDAKGKVQVMIQPFSLENLPSLWLVYFHNVSDEINLSHAFKNEAKEKEIANEMIFKIQDHLKEFSELALKDQMTGLGNFRYFEREIVAKLNESLKTKLPLGLIIMDVDKFKIFNDSYGHQQGDEVLRYVGKALNGTTRTSDIVARYGGEEFVLIVPNCGLKELEFVCEKVRKSVESIKVPYLKEPGHFLSVTISLGGISIAPYILVSNLVMDYKALLEQADRNLYHSKESGRNRATVTDWSSK